MAVGSYRRLHEAALARADKYASLIKKLYDDASSRFVKLASEAPFDGGGQFYFADYPELRKAVNDAVKTLATGVEQVVLRGTTAEWAKGLKDSKGMVEYVLKRYGIKNVSALEDADIGRYINNRAGALAAFQKRKIGGLSLSEKAWDLAQHQKIEAELARSISIGRSAEETAKQMQKWLVEPDKLFRRVRDEFGALRLSKNAKAYSPPVGTYRSSYKNALRLVRTETNMAYRSAEIEGYQEMDFIVGYEIHRSVTEYDCDVCETLAGKYPKDFEWSGWHPNCRCFITPILISEDEMAERRKAIINGEEYDSSKSENAVHDMPKNFKDWVADNEGRIADAKERGKLPYFLRDNYEQLESKYGMFGGESVTSSVVPQFAGVSNTELQSEHHDTIASVSEREEYIGRMTGITDKGRLSEIAKDVYDYTEGTLYDCKRVQNGMDAYLLNVNAEIAKAEKDIALLKSGKYSGYKDWRALYGEEKAKKIGAEWIDKFNKEIEELKQKRNDKIAKFGFYKDKADALEELIDKSPKWAGGTTYRIVPLKAKQIAQFNVGDVIGQGGLSSWSSDYDFCRRWQTGTKNACIFVCEAPQNGTSLKFGCCYDGSEILVSQKARWKIGKITVAQDGLTHILLTPIENAAGASF